jgi:hypothetical protein
VIYVTGLAEHLSAYMNLAILSAIIAFAFWTSLVVVAFSDFMPFIALSILIDAATRHTFDFKACIKWAFPILNSTTVVTFGLKLKLLMAP